MHKPLIPLRHRKSGLRREERLSLRSVGKSLKQLYQTYENAARKAGLTGDQMNFDAFKKSLLSKAKELKSQHGVTKLHYKVVVKDGKVVIKASAK
jgi:hypothetical protein